MSGVLFRAIGGMVVADHGPVALCEAQGLARLYARDAAMADGPWRRLCVERARAMHETHSAQRPGVGVCRTVAFPMFLSGQKTQFARP